MKKNLSLAIAIVALFMSTMAIAQEWQSSHSSDQWNDWGGTSNSYAYNSNATTSRSWHRQDKAKAGGNDWDLSKPYDGWQNNTEDQWKITSDADIGGVQASVASIINWSLATGDHRGWPFLIADKPAGEVILVAPDGSIINRSPALFGKRTGDNPMAGATPAGAFTMHQHFTDEKGYDGDLLIFFNDGNVVFALHRTYRLIPSERRLDRMMSPTPSDNRISNGCINVPSNFYNQYLSQMSDHRIYVLPETRSTFYNYENYNDPAMGYTESISSTYSGVYENPENYFEDNFGNWEENWYENFNDDWEL